MISLAHEMGPQAAPNEESKDRGCDDQRQPTLPTHEFDVVTHHHHEHGHREDPDPGG